MTDPSHADQRSSSPSGSGDVVLVTKLALAWEELLTAIRHRGFGARAVSLGQLAHELQSGTPIYVLLIDAGLPEPLEELEHVLQLSVEHGLLRAYLADGQRALTLIQRGAPGLVFPHPINVDALLHFIENDAAAAYKPSHVRESSAPEAAHRDTAPPPTHDSDVPPLVEFPAYPTPPDLESILSMDDQALRLPSDLPTQLSPELEQLMEAAEFRVERMERPSSIPPPDDLDIPLSSDWCEVLDSLDNEDDDHHTLHGPPSGVGPASLPIPSLLTDTLYKPPPPLPAASPKPEKREQKTTERPPRGHRAEFQDIRPTLPPPNSPPRRGAQGPESLRPSHLRTSAPSTPDRSRPTKPPPSRTSHPGEATTHMPFPPSAMSVRPSPPDTPPPSFPARSLERSPSAAQVPSASSSGKQPISPAPPGQRVPMSRVSASVEEAATTFPSPIGASRPYGPPAVPEDHEGTRSPYGAAFHTSPLPQSPPRPTATPASPPQGRPAEGAKPAGSQGQLLVFSPEGDALGAIALAIAQRKTGGLVFSSDAGGRTLVILDGDFVTAASSISDESLAAFLINRGDLDASVLAHPMPPFGKRACSALVAKGYLTQDDLWPVLRAHAEWLIGRVLMLSAPVSCTFVSELGAALRNEPTVFGGAAGAEIFVESVKRVIEPSTALSRLGSEAAVIDVGPHRELLNECNLLPEDLERLRHAGTRRLGELLRGRPPETAAIYLALRALGAIVTLSPTGPGKEDEEALGPDPYDEEAVRHRVKTRLSLVADSDYFSLLGVPHNATAYDIRRAYLELRRAFEPSRLLTAQTADLREDVRLIVEVLDEAYDILRDAHRRERYRRAIESSGPTP